MKKSCVLLLLFTICSAQYPDPQHPTRSPIVGKWRMSGLPQEFEEFTAQGAWRAVQYRDGKLEEIQSGHYLLEEDFGLLAIQGTTHIGTLKETYSFTGHYAVRGKFLLTRQVGLPIVGVVVKCPPVSCDLTTPFPPELQQQMLNAVGAWRPTPSRNSK
jgi:hypothetical protein